MKFIILCMLLVVPAARAQPNVAGLTMYRLGITTPDSLPAAYFREQPVYVKGTIALSCQHVRVFTADSVISAGVSIPHLTVLFYDNRLFRIVCDYTEDVKKVFLARYENGMSVPKSRLVVCESENGKPLILWGEVWQHGDHQARVVYADGYGSDCERHKTVRLRIASQRFSALSSDCDLTAADPFGEAFDRVLTGRITDRQQMEPKRREDQSKRPDD